MKQKSMEQMRILTGCIGFVLMSVNSGAPLLAQSENRLIFNQLPQATDPSIPGNAVGRGSRRPGDNDLCGKSDIPLTALMPHVPKPRDESSPYPDHVLGLTINSSPTFWFYVPYQPQRNLSAEFEVRELVNGKPQRFSRQTISLPSVPGLLPIQLQAKPLEMNKKYQWIFSVQCIPGEPSANDVVSGWVQRVDNPKLQGQLQQLKSLRQKVPAYAQAGVWHETLTNVAGDLCQSDRPLAERWFADLMRSIGLKDIATMAKNNLLRNCPKL